ncbi:MAG: SurA N-terminal domain-containing protein [Alphaproteobacteria bacterium]|nr:SurA N-terminal domain-containing protein [Alphaproteobacteria bacterium]
MLEYLRNAAEKPLAKFLIALLAFSFVGWGVAEWIFGNVAGDNTLIKVGDGEITFQQFSMERNREMAAMGRDEQRAVYTDPIVADQLAARVLSNLTSQRLAENRADDLGFVVSDARIAREIRSFPEFQENGQFSAYLFDYVLNNSGYTEAQFASILRSQVLRSMVLGAVGAPVSVPKFAVNAAYNARYATRDVEYATIDFDDFKVENPSDEQLRSFYAQNPRTVPEFRTISYILVPADMAKPDEYDAAYETAIKVEDDVIAGETFADTAKKHKAKHVTLKPFSADKRPTDDVLTDQVIANLFAMDEGMESEMIESKKGFVIARVDKIAPAHTEDFDKVKKDLVADWKHAEQKKQAYVRANEILVDLNKNGKLEGKKSVNVSRASGAPAALLNAAFNNPIETKTIVPDSDAFYVLNIKSESMPKADSKKMDAVRKELESVSQNALMDDYNSFLIREYPVRVNEKVYKRVFGK